LRRLAPIRGTKNKKRGGSHRKGETYAEKDQKRRKGSHRKIDEPRQAGGWGERGGGGRVLSDWVHRLAWLNESQARSPKKEIRLEGRHAGGKGGANF